VKLRKRQLKLVGPVSKDNTPGPIDAAASAVREAYQADILLYLGPVARPQDDVIIDLCASKKKHPNLLLCICTNGGDAHAAYRIARAIHRNYCDTEPAGKFFAFVNSTCASAGTLLAIGADTLIVSDHAELGPIDVQLENSEEVGERTSGLTPMQALDYLTQQSYEVFEHHFRSMRFDRKVSIPNQARVSNCRRDDKWSDGKTL
jgi:hypothetical protein